jgi:integrase
MANSKGVYKRGRIYWIAYAGVDGQIIRESSKSTKKSDAEAFYIDRKSLVKKGQNPIIGKNKNFTFDDLSSEYLKWAERQRSFRSKKGFIAQLINYYHNIPLRLFSPLMIENYQTVKIKKGNKPATINRHIATIKHMFNKAVEWEMAPEEILKKIKKVKLLEENNRRLRYLSVEEIQLLLSNCDNHLLPIVIMALNTGMRKSEILSLRWENVDLRNDFILLEKKKTESEEKYRLTRP